MVIGGLQKLSLVDYPGRICAVVFTQGCLFRCPYCHNPELIELKKKGSITQEEVLISLGAQKNFLEGVCITGGEPTLHNDLPEFINKIRQMGLLIKLDTNGINPGMIEELISKKLIDYFAMDLKHSWKKYNKIAGTNNDSVIENCKKTFELIQNSKIDHEFRTTMFPAEHVEEDFVKIAGQLNNGEKYYIQEIRYINNFDKNINKSKIIDAREVLKKIKNKYPKLIVEVR